jgi:hypothetical protein|tara:strand:- start:139 stop:471 length:333 start_codon:yes stop_codon:yes gene_type:complete
MADPVLDKSDIERFLFDIPEEFRERPGDSDPDLPAETGFSLSERLQWGVLLGGAAFIFTLIVALAGGIPLPTALLAAAVFGIGIGLLPVVPATLLATYFAILALVGGQEF